MPVPRACLTYGQQTCAEVEIDSPFCEVARTTDGASEPRSFTAMDRMFGHMVQAIREAARRAIQALHVVASAGGNGHRDMILMA